MSDKKYVILYKRAPSILQNLEDAYTEIRDFLWNDPRNDQQTLNLRKAIDAINLIFQEDNA